MSKTNNILFTIFLLIAISFSVVWLAESLYLPQRIAAWNAPPNTPKLPYWIP